MLRGKQAKVDRLRAAIPRGTDFVCDQLACYQYLHAGGLDVVDMHKNVGAAVIGRDKAISAICIEEFDPPTLHVQLIRSQRSAPRPAVGTTGRGLCCIVLAVILLMAPAAFHRIAYGGENTEAFYRLGSCLIVVAALPMALSITLDLYVAATRPLKPACQLFSPHWESDWSSCSCGDFSLLCYVRAGQASVGRVIPNCDVRQPQKHQ